MGDRDFDLERLRGGSRRGPLLAQPLAVAAPIDLFPAPGLTARSLGGTADGRPVSLGAPAQVGPDATSPSRNRKRRPRQPKRTDDGRQRETTSE